MSETSVAFYKAVKCNSRCLICGSHDIQMHHVNPSEKSSEVYRVAKFGDLFSTIKEINKCVPVCQEDHTSIHKGRTRGWLLGRFDNGERAVPDRALDFMPYTIWFAKKWPYFLFDFYRTCDFHEAEALSDVFRRANLRTPRRLHQSLGSDVDRPCIDVPGNTADLVWPPPGTTPYL